MDTLEIYKTVEDALYNCEEMHQRLEWQSLELQSIQNKLADLSQKLSKDPQVIAFIEEWEREANEDIPF